LACSSKTEPGDGIMEASETQTGGWTVCDEVNALLAHLRHTHSDHNVPIERKNAPLYDDTNLDMLVQLSRKDLIAFSQAITEIDKITGLGVQVLKDWVRKRAFHLEDLTKATGRKKRVNELTSEPEPDPKTGEREVPKLTFSPSKAAMAVTNYMPLRISATDTEKTPRLWSYQGQIWKPDGERRVGNLIDAVIGDLSYEHGLNETMRRVRALLERGHSIFLNLKMKYWKDFCRILKQKINVIKRENIFSRFIQIKV
jgi:hypothetical protein